MFVKTVLFPAAAALLFLAGCSEGANSPSAENSAAATPNSGVSHESEIAVRPPPPRGAIDYERIDSRIERLMGEPHMVGLAVAIVEDGEIRFLKGYGETVHEGGEPVATGTVFRWASLSKGVAGDLVAMLAANGALSLSDPAGRHAPSLRLPRGDEQKATVADILSHQLGLFGHAFDPNLEDGDDPRALRSRLATLDPICPPGQCHAYQNVAFDAASEIVAQVTGMSYREALQERLFGPLGMRHASASLSGLKNSESWARPHVGGRSPRPVEDIKEAYYRVPAAGGVNGSIQDLGIWLRAQMGKRSDVLSRPVLEKAQAPRVDTPRENRRRRDYSERLSDARYGLGWRIFDYSGRKVVGHHGGVRGYRAIILFDPERKTGVAALWNSSTWQPEGIEYEVMDMVYGLPFRDWLEIDDGETELEEEGETAGLEGSGPQPR